MEIPPALLERLPPDRREALREVLALDPRPRYQQDPERVYGFSFAGHEVKFTVDGDGPPRHGHPIDGNPPRKNAPGAGFHLSGCQRMARVTSPVAASSPWM